MYAKTDLTVYIVGSIKKSDGRKEVIDQTIRFKDLYFNEEEKSVKVPRIKILLKDSKSL